MNGWTPAQVRRIRRELLAWYDRTHRKLPWRETNDPYRIWISEVMLQQTRVAAVIPYYERFLEHFPTIEALAACDDEELLARWAGLGYYSRARNLKKAALQMAGMFPRDYDSIRVLAGIGDYTAAAVSSIAFNLPHAAVDGNVIRVLTRLLNHSGDVSSPAVREEVRVAADRLLDRTQPGKFNQAVMELGAVICLPKSPQCLLCPLAKDCAGRAAGTADLLPVKRRKPQTVRIDRTLLMVRQGMRFLLWKRPADARQLAGFWELPEPDHLPDVPVGPVIASFKHSITNHEYTFRVAEADPQHVGIGQRSIEFRWITRDELQSLPLSTTARKAVKAFHQHAR